ncbi:dynein gamma chain protein [Raoultibacter timonensis]|uniref:dynein gamma chain protein n=1 Tax=Raoultibacter timonensis TaxID=1907662 RepID=UPI0026DB311E|nr:dynein gamma chain protein [Raoultibacter timonensis]
MCTNGVNVGQLEQMIDQLDDYVALNYRWSHKLAHTAGDAGFATVSEKLHCAQNALAEVRAVLDEAKSTLESDASAAIADKTHMHLV